MYQCFNSLGTVPAFVCNNLGTIWQFINKPSTSALTKEVQPTQESTHLRAGSCINVLSEFHFLPPSYTFMTLITLSSKNFSRLPILEALNIQFLCVSFEQGMKLCKSPKISE
jgi:hypothetical protein